MIRLIFLLILASISSIEGFAQGLLKSDRSKQSAYEEIDFEGLMKRYFSKEVGEMDQVEGMYSVSCIITKRTKGLFSKVERDKVVERKDNYARVAVLRDWQGTNREYIEVSLSFKEAFKYPIVGEMNTLAEGTGLVYNHYEPGEAGMDFTMVLVEPDLLEGVYSFIKRRKLITYTLSYLKIYPKSETGISVK